MHVYVSNVSTGNVLFRGTYGDKLPDGASLLYTHAHVRAPSLSPSIEVASAWLEIPDGAVAVPSVQGRDGVFDVRSFGARADGVTSDSAAFRAALDAMSTVDTQSDREATLYIPPGTYALGADLLLERAVRVKGASRDRSRLVFGPYKGVKIFSLTNSPSGMGDGANVSIEDVTIALDESVIPNLPNWFPAAVYGAGARVLPAAPRASSVGNSWEYYYEAIKGGTTSATEPNWFGGTTGPGAQAPDPSSVWAPLTDYKRYAVVRSASRYDIFFLCTEPGTSKAGAEPAWNATLGDTTDDGPDLKWTTFSTEAYFIADGGTLASPGTGVVWACRLAAGIFAQTRFSLRRVAITGAVNAGLHVQATGAPNVVHKGNANGFAAYDLEVRRCGGGIVTRADECNAGLVSNAFITTRGPSNDKSFGIADRGLLGNRYIGIRVESCGGPVLDQTSPANSGALMGISAPATCGAVVNNSSQGYGLFGGFLAAGFAPGSSYMGASGPSDWRDVWAVSRDANGDPINEAKLYAAPYVMGFKAYDDAAFCAVGYDFPGAGLTGWWSLFHSSVGTTALAWSGTNAEDAPGSVVGGGYALAYPGLLLGSPATMIASADAKPVAGSWRRGDLVINAMAASGDPSFWQCVSEAPLDFLDGPALP
ncbi:MAG: hypothetical protein JST00_14755 [Deltaproteobacteria bacterium]|nr:hypothetical protein [Deltaproteobacteria bacterium]